MTSSTTDVIDLLAGIREGSSLHALRTARPQTRDNAQKSYEALFEPAHEGDVSRSERFALASFVAGLHVADNVSRFYLAALEKAESSRALIDAVKAEADGGRTVGPYGHYPAGPLSAEDREGLVYHVSEATRLALGSKLSAAFEHAHLLVYRPREASAEALQRLLNAGWTTTGVVTLSQIVAFLSFQIRVVAGLSALSTASIEQAVSA
ncbi:MULTISPECIES: CMD domain protein [Rhizobium]|uniref:CMD domain protein, Avi_7170 family n=1 Tax=Rhizobium miluonense TaxID=411945 RepID=A0A1C3UZC2_9HYPH|nr:CMD domain protein [Rhizobium miluonense]SCB20886.1 CMD domain protein, Avi_7170 family [Rhizobium miluonense]